MLWYYVAWIQRLWQIGWWFLGDFAGDGCMETTEAGRLLRGFSALWTDSVVWKQRWTSSISKKSGGGQTVVKVTFFLTDFLISRFFSGTSFRGF